VVKWAAKEGKHQGFQDWTKWGTTQQSTFELGQEVIRRRRMVDGFVAENRK